MLMVEVSPEQLVQDPELRPKLEESSRKLSSFLTTNRRNDFPIPPSQADLAVVTGSAKLEVGFYGAEKFRECNLVICSGNRGGRTANWVNTEAEIFASIFSRQVEVEPRSMNCDQNYLYTIEDGIRILGRPLNHVFLCCLQPVQRRFDFLQKVHGEGRCANLTMFSPPLPSNDCPATFLWKIVLQRTEVRNLVYMRDNYPDKFLEIPFWVEEESEKLKWMGIKIAEPRTKALFALK